MSIMFNIHTHNEWPLIFSHKKGVYHITHNGHPLTFGYVTYKNISSTSNDKRENIQTFILSKLQSKSMQYIK